MTKEKNTIKESSGIVVGAHCCWFLTLDHHTTNNMFDFQSAHQWVRLEREMMKWNENGEISEINLLSGFLIEAAYNNMQ